MQLMSSIDRSNSNIPETSLLILNEYIPPRRTAWKVGTFKKAHLAIRQAIRDRQLAPDVFVTACKDLSRAGATEMREAGFKWFWLMQTPMTQSRNR